MESSLKVSEESLKNAKNSEVKQLEAWRREEEKFSVKIKSLETDLENLKVSQKEENAAAASSSIQIKVILDTYQPFHFYLIASFATFCIGCTAS